MNFRVVLLAVCRHITGLPSLLEAVGLSSPTVSKFSLANGNGAYQLGIGGQSRS